MGSGFTSFELEVSAALDEVLAMSDEFFSSETVKSKRCDNVAPKRNDAVKPSKIRDERVEKAICELERDEALKIPDGDRINKKDAVNHRKSSENNTKALCSRASVGNSRVISLASGSRANCTLIDGGGTRILIDFGLSCRMLGGFLKDFGLLISDIDAVFITHEHADHVGGLATFFKKYDIPVHMTEPSFLAYTRKAGFDHRDKITVHEVEYKVEIGGFTVSSCEVCHDSAACVSYLVEGNGVSFCTCTDLGFVPERVFKHVERAENVIIESNHDVALLENGSYPDDLKRRIRSRSGHLSNEQCDDTLIRLVDAGVKRILLGHVSPENNDPHLALQAAIIALEKAGKNVEYIGVAPRLEPIVLFSEEK